MRIDPSGNSDVGISSAINNKPFMTNMGNNVEERLIISMLITSGIYGGAMIFAKYDINKTISYEANNAGEIVGAGSDLRKIDFFDGLQHAKIKHFFGNGKESLKVLDPGGTSEKWLKYIIELAQSGKGTVKDVASGQIMEVMSSMSKSNGSGNLNIGVKLFKAAGSDFWKLTTILTRQ